ncbi:hypothetical protein Bca4012_009988 [Brassica carinata]
MAKPRRLRFFLLSLGDSVFVDLSLDNSARPCETSTTLDLSFYPSTSPRFYGETSTTPPSSRETSKMPPLSGDLPPSMKQSAYLSVDSSSLSLSTTVLSSLSWWIFSKVTNLYLCNICIGRWSSSRKSNRKDGSRINRHEGSLKKISATAKQDAEEGSSKEGMALTGAIQCHGGTEYATVTEELQALQSRTCLSITEEQSMLVSRRNCRLYNVLLTLLSCMVV